MHPLPLSSAFVFTPPQLSHTGKNTYNSVAGMTEPHVSLALSLTYLAPECLWCCQWSIWRGSTSSEIYEWFGASAISLCPPSVLPGWALSRWHQAGGHCPPPSHQPGGHRTGLTDDREREKDTTERTVSTDTKEVLVYFREGCWYRRVSEYTEEKSWAGQRGRKRTWFQNRNTIVQRTPLKSAIPKQT